MNKSEAQSLEARWKIENRYEHTFFKVCMYIYNQPLNI